MLALSLAVACDATSDSVLESSRDSDTDADADTDTDADTDADADADADADTDTDTDTDTDHDKDDDGYAMFEGDCDDHDPEVHPGASEVCLNDLDDDCNGVSDLCLDDVTTLAQAVVRGNAPIPTLGWGLAGLPDITGDGVDDLVAVSQVKGPAHVSLLAPGADGDIAGAEALSRADEAAPFGYGFASGDFDGDGSKDLAVLWQGASATQMDIHSGPIDSFAYEDRDAEITFSAGTGGTGWSHGVYGFHSPGDLNHDGFEDLITSRNESWSSEGPAVLFGPFTGVSDIDLVGAMQALMPDEASDQVIARANDLDGDGFVDLAYDVVLDTLAYRTDIALGPITPAAEWSCCAATIENSAAVFSGGDANADGYGDLWVEGTPKLYTGGAILPSVDAATAAFEATIQETMSGVKYTGGSTGDRDLDGDGVPDLVLSDTKSDLSEVDGGYAFVLLGPFSGSVDPTERATLALTCPPTSCADADGFGHRTVLGGDYDGDGNQDVVIADYIGDDAADGALYFLRGGTWW